jgi:hypothetical protein
LALALALLAGAASLPSLTACGGTTPGAPFRRAKLAAAEEFDCRPADIHEVGGMEWAGGARYALDACGQRYTYECDEAACTRACDYAPVASTYTGEGVSEGDHSAFAQRWAAAEFDCHDVRQVEHARGRYTLFVCGQEVVYDCGDEGCARRCD